MTASISGMSFDHLIYMRIFEGCNVACDHCFIPNNPKRMTLQQISDAADDIARRFAKGSNLHIQWHGGEPTVLGPEFMKAAIELVENRLCQKFKITHGIQTNLILYDHRWKEIFQHYFPNTLGVSWDPGIRHLKAKGKQSNEYFESIFWKNFQTLRHDGINPCLVITATKPFFDTFTNSYTLFEFLSARDVHQLHIERLTFSGVAQDNWALIGVNNRQYSEGMSKLFKAYARYSLIHRNSPGRIFISPFDGLSRAIINLKSGGKGGYGCLSGACDTKFHTYEQNGYLHGCTALTATPKTNHNQVRLFNFADTRQRRQIDCHTCNYKSICSTGCLATSWDDGSNECSGGRILFDTIEAEVIRPSFVL